MFIYNLLVNKFIFIALLLSQERNVVYQVLYQHMQNLFVRLIKEWHTFGEMTVRTITLLTENVLQFCKKQTKIVHGFMHQLFVSCTHSRVITQRYGK